MKLFSRQMLTIVCCGLASVNIHAAQMSVKNVLKTDKSWNDATLPGFSSGQTELTVLKFTIPAGTKTPVHMHPMNGAGYIISGELTMYATDDPHGKFSAASDHVKKITLKAGDAWTETVNTWHWGENKGKDDAVFILTFAGDKGTPATLTLGTFE